MLTPASLTGFLDAASAICGEGQVLPGPAIEPRYLEPARYAAGQAAALLRPATADEAARLLPLCAAHGLRVVPQGAHTGLVRAATPDDAQRDVLLSTERLREVFAFDAWDRTLRVSAGYRLSEINERLAPHGLMLPIDLSADPSVGGLVSHNTGGTRMLRYGDVRANTLALRVALADGQVVQLGQGLQKDNAQLALHQLFIGASGALGLVLEATFRLAAVPRQQAVAMIAPRSLADVFPFYQRVMARFPSLVSAFEAISREAFAAALASPSEAQRWFAGQLPDYALLLELSSELGADQLDLQALLQQLLEDEFGEAVVDAVLGADADCWHLRHHISEGLRRRGKVVGFDVSLPRRHFMAFREAGRAWLAEHFAPATLADFGHLGDGGLHFNLVWPATEPLDEAALREGVYALVRAHGGSISAEHGVGPQLQQAYWRHTDPAVLALSGDLQGQLDPGALLAHTHWGAAATVAAAKGPDAIS
ncbi:FAD-binding oxidoreductase [Pelomonas sp. APW6]|uniref:FAD-binding oxidoreductase n=1 Tax=Roseateles subflavus TaxID=3053353 RepID=A0ABT7LER3_9BURK|nr:FAD-binding oxidoreductase [Pelomonas sp. APW6]MDL5031351.1 FAD-binding oxidoreductase [Pelomonas sp. APW6]